MEDSYFWNCGRWSPWPRHITWTPSWCGISAWTKLHLQLECRKRKWIELGACFATGKNLECTIMSSVDHHAGSLAEATLYDSTGRGDGGASPSFWEGKLSASCCGKAVHLRSLCVRRQEKFAARLNGRIYVYTVKLIRAFRFKFTCCRAANRNLLASLCSHTLPSLRQVLPWDFLESGCAVAS